MKIEIAVSIYDIKRVAKSYYYNSLIEYALKMLPIE